MRDKMFRIKRIQYAGYAAATCEGVSFIAYVATNKIRFPDIVEGTARLQIIIPNDLKKEMKYNLLARKDIKKDEFRYYCVEEKLSTDEIKHIEEWCKENKIKEEARKIADEYTKELKNFFAFSNKLEEYNKERRDGTLTEKRRIERETLRVQMKRSFKRTEELQDIKYK
jgi:hypothetical protein